jgi:hypothetical protein
VREAQDPSEHDVRVVCASMLGLSYASNRIGIGSPGRCSNTFALSVKRQNGSDLAMRRTLDEC